ncbi:MAG TPA: response regulator [Aggregatilineales bacterium]|nr:response regulator [Aggregatilineales bacterium]
MTVKILIVDPDISFSVPIKRALEQRGDYRVHTFASGQPALEMLQRDAHDVVILDADIADIALPALIHAMRRVQPWLYVMISTTPDRDKPAVRPLNVQGMIAKPYLARNLIHALSAAVRWIEVRRTAPGGRGAAEQPPSEPLRTLATLTIPDAPPSLEDTPNLGRKLTSGAISEPPIPDDATARDVFRRTSKPLPPEPPLPEEATTPTVNVAGRTSDSAPPPPDSLPEMPPEEAQTLVEASLAALALEITDDATIPLERLPEAFESSSEHLPPDARPTFNPLALWQHADDLNEPTLVEAPPTLPASLQGEPSDVLEDDMARTFRTLIGEETSPLQPVSDALPPEADIAHPPPPPADAADAPEPVTMLARMALYLTQITTGSAARAALLIQDGSLIAQSGGISERDIRGCVADVAKAWSKGAAGPSPESTPAKLSYVELPSGSDYLMYSVQTVEGMILVMLFPGDVPLGTIRKQASSLRGALISVPDSAEAVESEAVTADSEAATTLPSRPTDMIPPEGLREALTIASPLASTPESPALAAPSSPERPTVPYAAFTFVWLPRSGTLSDYQVAMLPTWLERAALPRFWDIESVQGQPTHAVIHLRLPEGTSPYEARTTLQQETALSAGADDFWAEVYYLVTGGREVTPQEVANLLEFHREAAG